MLLRLLLFESVNVSGLLFDSLCFVLVLSKMMRAQSLIKLIYK